MTLSKALVLCVLFSAVASGQPTINTARPRIWLDAAKLAEIQAKPSGSAAEQAQWTAMKDWTDTWCTDTDPETSFDCLRNAMVIHMTDNTLDPPGAVYSTYAQIACASADYHVTLGQINTDTELKNGNQNRWYTTWAIVVYDWLHDDCTASQMANIKAQLIKVPDFMQSSWDLPKRTSNNLGIGYVMNGILAPIALHGDWASAQDELDETWTNAIDQYMFPCQDDDTASAIQYTCYGGAWPEGTEYAPESKFLLWRTFEGLRTGTDTDPFARSDVQKFMDDGWEFLKHYTGPALYSGHFDPMMYRDLQHYRDGTGADTEWVENMFEYFARTNQTTKAQEIKYWLDNYSVGYSNSGDKWQSFLYFDPDYTATDYRSGSTNFTGSPFMLLSRSSWSTDATFFSTFNLPTNFDHFHNDSGSWALYRGGEWLSAEIPGYFNRVILSPYAHNSLMANVGGPGCYNNSGPLMGYFTREGSGWKAACDENDTYCYAQHNLTTQFACSSYQVTKDVEWAFRDVLYVKPDLVVYSDRLQFITNLDAPYASMVQFKGQPSVASQRITHTVGSQKIVVDSVLPANTNIGIRNRDKSTGTEYITWAKKIDDDNCIVCVDLRHQLSTGNSYTISGITGDWSDLNGTWTITVPAFETFGPVNGTGQLPYRDGAEYYKECFVIESTGSFSGITTNWDFANNISGRSSVGTGDQQFNNDTWYAFIAGNSQANTQTGLVTVQAMDSSSSPVTTAAIATIGSNHQGVEIDLATPVAAVFNISSAPVTSASFTTTYSGTGNVYVSGFYPGQYDVTLNGSEIVSNQSVGNDGVLAFSSTSGALVVAQGTPLTKFWVSNGSYKVPQDDLPPSTTNYNWNGDTASTFGGKNETVGLVLFIGNDTGSDVSEVSVELTSFTGTTDGIVSVEVSSMNAWNMVDRPIQQYLVHYLPIAGLSRGLTWDTYDECPFPERFQAPYTVQGTGQCLQDGGTGWTDRPDHDKYYPEILEPYEHVKVSSFTVYSSSSQAVWFDIYISTFQTVETYSAEIVVREGVTVSTRIPVSLEVKNYTLPDTPSLPVLVAYSDDNIQERHHGVAGGVTQDTEPYLTTRRHYLQTLKAHSVIPFGNDRVTADLPWVIDQQRLDGTLYSQTTGYWNRGSDTGDSCYGVGVYAAWQGQWGTTDAEAICGHISNWKDWFKANHPSATVLWYTQDESTTTVETWAMWESTVTTCQVAGYDGFHSFLTTEWPTVRSHVPSLEAPATWSWLTVSSDTWQSDYDHYVTYGSTSNLQAWVYNGIRPWTPPLSAIEGEGVDPAALGWQLYKSGITGWFYWESTYYDDYQNGNGDNDLWNVARTFGLDTGSDADLGRAGSNYTNGDGILLYPGKDTIFPNDSRGVDYPFVSWRLKMLRRGVQDADYLTQADAIDSASTTTILDTVMPDPIMWQKECYDTGDCSYTYGGPSWGNDSDVFEQARADLADIIVAGAPAASSSPTTFKTQGRITFRGGVTIQ